MKTLSRVALALLLTAPLALAAHTPQGRCDAGDAPGLSIVQVGEGDDAWYVDDRGIFNGVWVYEETNGIWVDDDPFHSLQRGGASPYVPDDADPCIDDPLVIPDTLYV